MSVITEETSKPLDSAEISRMFEAMRAGKFQAAPEQANQAKSAFTAKSLFDIARAATREERIVATAKSNAKPSMAEIEEAEVVADIVPNLAESPDPFAPDSAPESDANLGLIDDLLPQNMDVAVMQAADLGPRPANQDELKTEWGRGFSAGEERARADHSAEVEARIAILDAVILAFQSGEAIAHLRQEIVNSVKALASSRAGSQIDDMPEGYLAKIEDLVDRIRTDLAQPRLRLNPDDIAAIKPYLQGSQTLSMVTITADQDLARGDLELSTDGLRYADKLMPKPNAAAKTARKKPSPDGAGSGTSP